MAITRTPRDILEALDPAIRFLFEKDGPFFIAAPEGHAKNAELAKRLNNIVKPYGYNFTLSKEFSSLFVSPWSLQLNQDAIHTVHFATQFKQRFALLAAIIIRVKEMNHAIDRLEKNQLLPILYEEIEDLNDRVDSIERAQHIEQIRRKSTAEESADARQKIYESLKSDLVKFTRSPEFITSPTDHDLLCPTRIWAQALTDIAEEDDMVQLPEKKLQAIIDLKELKEKIIALEKELIKQLESYHQNCEQGSAQETTAKLLLAKETLGNYTDQAGSLIRKANNPYPYGIHSQLGKAVQHELQVAMETAERTISQATNTVMHNFKLSAEDRQHFQRRELQKYEELHTWLSRSHFALYGSRGYIPDTEDTEEEQAPRSAPPNSNSNRA
ncbi:MAG: hypothetical protein A3E83_03375 [Gammaproteobacteria bacterium RIFCSPHIGHO2_12_FULL_41_20]|nr:MAG: hypothetical protein A3E83_03375 [Gammaproteobacteria bacterium RIFCSPHIGHO2_12_FULL_41_20]